MRRIGKKGWEDFLRIEGWSSGCKSVQKLLSHLRRQSANEGSRQGYCRAVYRLCRESGIKDPDELVKMDLEDITTIVQDHLDRLLDQKDSSGEPLSKLTVKAQKNCLMTFFHVNGFKNSKEIEMQIGKIGSRYRKRKEYIPTKDEIYMMVDATGKLLHKAIILFLYSTGLRNATMRAVIYGDVKEDVDNGEKNIHVKVYEGMKKRIPAACKNGIEYFTFTSEEASYYLRLYLAERRRKYGGIEDREPLFPPDHNRVPLALRKSRFMSPREVQFLVKNAARKAGLKEAERVVPHCLRKSFKRVLMSDLKDSGHMDKDDQLFLEGHILPGSEDQYYNKTDTLEVRAQYARLNFSRSNPEIEALRDENKRLREKLSQPDISAKSSSSEQSSTPDLMKGNRDQADETRPPVLRNGLEAASSGQDPNPQTEDRTVQTTLSSEGGMQEQNPPEKYPLGPPNEERKEDEGRNPTLGRDTRHSRDTLDFYFG